MKKTSFSITSLTMMVLYFMFLNGLRTYAIILNWKVLLIYQSHPGPIYMLIFSLSWFLIGLFLIVNIYRKNPRTPEFIYITAGLYTTWFWIDRILFQHRIEAILFPAVGTIVLLLIIMILIRHRDSKIYFQRA